jgi:threonine dehydratase
VSVLAPPTLDDVRAARVRLHDSVLRTPLVRFEPDEVWPEIFLKLENLQPIGSFKLRGALNRMRASDPAALAAGVYTASAGNMAQGVAWAARSMGIPATAIVPDSAPRTKLDAIAKLGAKVEPVPYETWWKVMRDHGRPGARGVFVHPFADAHVMAGNGTIALEVLEALHDVDAFFVPWGGGGLTCGIAAAARALKPDVQIYACEIEGAAPLAASLAAGSPQSIDSQRSFVDGIGGPSVFPEMWPFARALVTASVTITVEQVAEAVRLLARRARVVAEGAGAAALAAARAHARTNPRLRRIVCVVSGGNIDDAALATILAGRVPQVGIPPAI